MVKKAQLLEDVTDLTDRIKGRIVKKEQASGSSTRPTNGKKRPFNNTDEPNQERKPKVFTLSAPNKHKYKHCEKLGHTAEECWRKVGTNIYCKDGVDTPHTGVDTMFQDLRQKVDTKSDSVDTRWLSQKACFSDGYLRSTANAGRSTLDGSPRRPVYQMAKAGRHEMISDTRDLSQGIVLQVWDSVSTHLMGKSTHSGISVT
ncbi:hypothetical protein Taro_048368 [Colocasia esculenta]|uniref:Uncharacterized protein n=1 Tax=Colocasia esculenta TaxID=4460 RepID=A0A843WXZ8_COLES|nr:hypothetical protein [Colocasia esculenta]